MERGVIEDAGKRKIGERDTGDRRHTKPGAEGAPAAEDRYIGGLQPDLQMAASLYSEDKGRPTIDPVVLFKMVLIQHQYGPRP